MLIDKPDWVHHEGNPIWSIDVDWEGKRVATAGQDGKVRVWSLQPILDVHAEQDASAPRVLATLADHQGCVAVARFSPSGQHLLASGADDKKVLVFQLRPGPGRAAFGSKDAPSVENWARVHVLQGHTMDVVDITWCPDGSKLASCSVDNTIRVWQVGSGACVATLTGHHGCVRGVAWDPYDHYLASQGESDGIFLWSTSDWSNVHVVDEPSLKELSTAMVARPGWSPDGQMLAGTKAFSKPLHQAVIIMRSKWTCPYQLCGHKGPVLVARHNPHMFFDEKEADTVRTVCAVGSADRMFSVWTVTQPRPVYVATGVFRHGVMDLAWTPDGYSLLACSYDGSVAAVTFTQQELGRSVPESTMQELARELYGEAQPRGRALTTDYTLLKDTRQPQDQSQPAPARAATAVVHVEATGVQAAATNGSAKARRIVPQAVGAPAGGAAMPPPAAPLGAKPGGSAAGGALAALDARLGPGGHTLSGSATGPASSTQAAAGRKRMAPTPIGHTAEQQPVSSGLAAGPTSSTAAAAASRPTPSMGPPAKRAATQLVSQPAAAAAGPRAGQLADGSGQLGAQLELQPVVAARQPPQVVVHVDAKRQLSVPLGTRPAEGLQGGQEVVLLEAQNNVQGPVPGSPLLRLQCTQGGRALWTELLPGTATSLTGSLHYAAVGLANGDLLVLSAAGRRLVPPICLGSPAAFMASNDAWQLLVLTQDGWVKLWDVQLGKCRLNVSMASVLTACSNAQVRSVQLATTGAPVVVLSNQHVYTYQEDWQAWVRVADPSTLASSALHSGLSGAQGELGRLQAAAANARSLRDVTASTLQGLGAQDQATRAHLESNLAAALALRSAPEWKRLLGVYARYLVKTGDEVRLRELVHELLGPPSWTPARQAALGEGPRVGPLGTDAGSYNPSVLGYNKRSLLRTEVLHWVKASQAPRLQDLALQWESDLERAEAVWNPALQHQPQARRPAKQGGAGRAAAGITAVSTGTDKAAGAGPSRDGTPPGNLFAAE